MGFRKSMCAAVLLGSISAAGCSSLIDRSLRRTPIEVTHVTSGQAHSCALTPAGEAHCWGLNSGGQVGSRPFGPTVSLPTPVEGRAFASLEAGDQHTCGIAVDGKAYCWGLNVDGQLGIGKAILLSWVPLPVSFPDPAVAITAGAHHGCLLDRGGRAHCWGLNNLGELGQPPDSTVLPPTPVNTALRFTKISAGWEHTCGLAEDGSAHCWGSNTFGQLGDGTTTNRDVPIQVVTPPLTDLSAGTVHTCGVGVDGTAICWGGLASLALGRAADEACLLHACTLPGPVDGDIRFDQITAGLAHTCGTADDGRAFCWGTGHSGAIGNCQTTPFWPSPEIVCGDHRFAQVSAGGDHTCGFTSDGEGWCWGANDNFQLGNTFFSSFGPRPIASPLP
ncbi:MAG: RCC1 domain-containing protein [Longimicrobiales bacterium]